MCTAHPYLSHARNSRSLCGSVTKEGVVKVTNHSGLGGMGRREPGCVSHKVQVAASQDSCEGDQAHLEVGSLSSVCECAA